MWSSHKPPGTETTQFKTNEAHAEAVGPVISTLATFLLEKRPFPVVAGSLIAVSGWRPIVFTIVRNDLRRLFRRPLILVFFLRKSAG